MKLLSFSLLLTIALCFGWQNVDAQSLSFSRVIKISSAEDTVPPGKVWKMVALLTNFAYQSGGTNSSCGSSTAPEKRTIEIDGNKMVIQGEGIGTGSSSIIHHGGYSLPFWLPAGSTLSTRCSSTLLSVVEFTVVP